MWSEQADPEHRVGSGEELLHVLMERQAVQWRRNLRLAGGAATSPGEQRQVAACRVEGPAARRGVHGAGVGVGVRVGAEPPQMEPDRAEVVPAAPAVDMADVGGAGHLVEGGADQLEPPGVPQVGGADCRGVDG